MDLGRQEEERGYNPSPSHSPAALPPPPPPPTQHLHPMIKDSAFSKPLLPPNSSLVQRGSAERSGDTRNGAGGGGYSLTPSPFNPAPHRHHAMPGRSGGGGGLKSPALVTSGCGNSVQIDQVAWNYRECQRNHAAGIGGHVVDGCCEYMPSDDTTLRCAACGCHRSFHRKVCNPNPNSGTPPLYSPNGAAMHSNKAPPQLLPPPPVPPPSQPPQSTTDQSSSEEMITGTPQQSQAATATASPTKKRYRTKFTPEQKAKMFRFAESLSWRFQKPDDEAIDKFCAESGVNRQVLKVWMHNNKYTYKKQEQAQYQPSPPPQQQHLLPQEGQHQDHHHQQMH